MRIKPQARPLSGSFPGGSGDGSQERGSKVTTRKTATAISLGLLATFVLTIASPMASYASSNGSKNTAIALAAATVLLMGQKNKTPALATAAGAVYAYNQYKDKREDEQRRDRWGYYRGRDDRYRSDSRYRDDDRYRNDDRYRDEYRLKERLRTDHRYNDRDKNRRDQERYRYTSRDSRCTTQGRYTWNR